jgi:hypothetical protein
MLPCFGGFIFFPLLMLIAAVDEQTNMTLSLCVLEMSFFFVPG